jgi:uncharacterized protein YneF (UPF0154 family)
MSNKMKGTLAGIGASLAGVALWVVLSLIGFIAGIAGALMGMLFIFVYQKINKDDKTKYPHIVACALIVVEIVIAELLSLAVVAASNGVSLGAALEIGEVRMWLWIDIIVGLLLGYLVFGGYLFSLKRKDQMQNMRQPGAPGQNPYQNGQPIPYGDAGNPAAPVAPYGDAGNPAAPVVPYGDAGNPAAPGVSDAPQAYEARNNETAAGEPISENKEQ